MRVASLIPSGTEIVSALGMADVLVGRSHCCDFPPGVEELPVLSRPKVDPTADGAEIDRVVRELMASGESVYDVLLEPLIGVAPDLVITQDHCDACAVSLSEVEEAVRCANLAGAELCTLHPHDLDAVCDDFVRVAGALGVPERGARLVRTFRERLSALAESAQRRPSRPRVALIEWLEPPMVAGGWIPELARLAGLEPVLVTEARSFLEADWDDVRGAEPDAVILLPCGFDVKRTHSELATGAAGSAIDELIPDLPLGCWVVDGDALFNRPGPRLADSAELLAALFDTDAPTPLGAFHGLWSRLPGGRVGEAVPS